MKKQIVGFLAGSIFMLSATALADDVKNLVGSKVQGQSTVNIEDRLIDTIIVDGKNYAPVREIGEAAGYTVSNDGKKVILQMEVENTIIPIKSPSPSYSLDQLQQELKKTSDRMITGKEALARIQDSIDSGQYTGEELQYLTNKLKQAQERIAKDEKKVQELESNIAQFEQ